jgi:hypothetical protein
LVKYSLQELHTQLLLVLVVLVVLLVLRFLPVEAQVAAIHLLVRLLHL